MLRSNLATRPFYNDRAVRFVIGLAIVLVAALTAFNVLQVLSLNARATETSERAEMAEARTAQLRQRATTITQEMDAARVAATQGAAREANQLIERRVFSWTELFNRFEHTLPADVRISAVEPQFDREGRMLLSVTVVSRRVEDLNAFMDQLEASGGLRDVLSRQDDPMEDGTLRSVIQGYYTPVASAAQAAPSPATSEPHGQNESPAAPVPPASARGEAP